MIGRRYCANIGKIVGQQCNTVGPTTYDDVGPMQANNSFANTGRIVGHQCPNVGPTTIGVVVPMKVNNITLETIK